MQPNHPNNLPTGIGIRNENPPQHELVMPTTTRGGKQSGTP